MWEQTCRQPANATNGRSDCDVPTTSVETVRGVGQTDGNDEADCPRGHRQKLRLNRFVAKASDDCRREESERSLGHDIRNIGQIVCQHSRAECRRHPFGFRGVVSVVATAMLLEPVLRKPFVVLVEPFRSCRIVWQTEPERDGADDSNDALNDKQPSEALEPPGAVGMSDAKRNAAPIRNGLMSRGLREHLPPPKSTSKVTKRHHHGDA